MLFTGTVLLVTSALNGPLGLTTFCAGTLSVAVVAIRQRRSPLPLLRHVPGVLPLVAGLFVLVEAVAQTVSSDRGQRHRALAQASPPPGQLAGGFALLSNVANNLPVGLVAGSLKADGRSAGADPCRLLVGVDLGPNCRSPVRWRRCCGWWRCREASMSARSTSCASALVMPPALIGALLLL